MYYLNDAALEGIAAGSLGDFDEMLAGGVSTAVMGAAIGSLVPVIGVVPGVVSMFYLGVGVMRCVLWLESHDS